MQIPGPEGGIQTAPVNGSLYCPLINVAYQLRDVPAGSGFVCVPGAHKATIGPGAWPGPGPAFTMESRQGIGLSIEFASMLQSGHLIQPELRRGDILIFPSAASVHGTLPWQDTQPRRAVLFGYPSLLPSNQFTTACM